MTLFVFPNKTITFSLFLWMLYLEPLEQWCLWNICSGMTMPSARLCWSCGLFLFLCFKSILKITFCIAMDARMLIWIRPDLFNKSNIGKRIGIRTIWFITWIADDWPKLSISDWLKCCYDESWQNNPILESFILSCWNESYLTLGCMEACECNIYFFI